MNKARRKAIDAVAVTLDGIAGTIADAISELEGLRDEEQEYFDAMPESFQSGEKGEIAQTAIDALETAISALEEFSVDDVTASLGEAAS